jgi:hypothetical protein
VQKGERFGMIKFGSRTELFVAKRTGFVPCVAVGDKVKGGLTILGEARDAHASGGDGSR